MIVYLVIYGGNGYFCIVMYFLYIEINDNINCYFIKKNVFEYIFFYEMIIDVIIYFDVQEVYCNMGVFIIIINY